MEIPTGGVVRLRREAFATPLPVNFSSMFSRRFSLSPYLRKERGRKEEGKRRKEEGTRRKEEERGGGTGGRRGRGGEGS